MCRINSFRSSLAWLLSFTVSYRLPCVGSFCRFALMGGSHYPGVLGRGHVCMYLPLSPGLSIHGLPYVVPRWWQEECAPTSVGVRGALKLSYFAVLPRCMYIWMVITLFVLWWFLAPTFILLR